MEMSRIYEALLGQDTDIQRYFYKQRKMTASFIHALVCDASLHIEKLAKNPV
jgi:hypothetical protein